MNNTYASLLARLPALRALDPTDETQHNQLQHTLSAFRRQLLEEDETLHLLWFFAPQLIVLVCRTSRRRPATVFLQQRLEGLPVWFVEEELFHIGNLKADTILLQLEDDLDIYIRQSEYEKVLQSEIAVSKPSFLAVCSCFSGPKALLRWRQEVNLAHEWGHIMTNTEIAYKEPLLQKLSAYPPSLGMPIFAWFDHLLEGLAECYIGHGPLSFCVELHDLGEPLKAEALLRDRQCEYDVFDTSSPGFSVYTALSKICSHALVDSGWPEHLEHGSDVPWGKSTHRTFLYQRAVQWDALQRGLQSCHDCLTSALVDGIANLPEEPGGNSWLRCEKQRVFGLLQDLIV